MIEPEKKPEAAVAGRPRSGEAHQAILRTTMKLLEEGGYRALTIEGIAARAGVGKKTIYRWWRSKAEVVLEALMAYTEISVPFLNTGSLKGDLLSYFEHSFPGLQGESANLLRGLVAEAQMDTEFAREFQRVFIVPRKQELVELLRRGIQRGELSEETNLEVLADMIYGAKWYRFLLYPAPLDEVFAREIVELVGRMQKEANWP